MVKKDKGNTLRNTGLKKINNIDSRQAPVYSFNNYRNRGNAPFPDELHELIVVIDGRIYESH